MTSRSRCRPCAACVPGWTERPFARTKKNGPRGPVHFVDCQMAEGAGQTLHVPFSQPNQGLSSGLKVAECYQNRYQPTTPPNPHRGSQEEEVSFCAYGMQCQDKEESHPRRWLFSWPLGPATARSVVLILLFLHLRNYFFQFFLYLKNLEMNFCSLESASRCQFSLKLS